MNIPILIGDDASIGIVGGIVTVRKDGIARFTPAEAFGFAEKIIRQASQAIILAECRVAPPSTADRKQMNRKRI